jgi:hypothetical protein
VSVAVRPDARPGADGTVAIDPARSLWIGPSGQPYPQRVQDGSFVVLGPLSISDVLPARGGLLAGSTVTVRGLGFQAGADIEIDGVLVGSTAFVGETELATTIAQSADMYGRKVNVTNPDHARASYRAHPRTDRLPPSTRPLLAATDPIFAPQTFSSAAFVSSAAASGQFLALALQNPGDETAGVTVELRSAAAGLVASTALDLPPRTWMSREASELFPGAAVPEEASLLVRSSLPVQMLGLVGDEAAGSVAPLVPALAFP